MKPPTIIVIVEKLNEKMSDNSTNSNFSNFQQF